MSSTKTKRFRFDDRFDCNLSTIALDCIMDCKADRMSYTPGPWYIDLDLNLDEQEPYTCIAETSRYSIFGIYQPNLDNETAYALDRANAKLIVAAPELLEALETLMTAGVFHDVSNSNRTAKALELANYAIAKAKGES